MSGSAFSTVASQLSQGVISIPSIAAAVASVGLWTYVAIATTLAALYALLYTGGRRAPTKKAVPSKRNHGRGSGDKIVCASPATGKQLSVCKAYTPDEVKRSINESRAAAKDWAKTSFDERRATLMDMLDWVLAHQDLIVEWSVGDSGKTMTEAILGEVMTSCEKIRWLVAHGESCLATEHRPVASLLMTKTARVEYHPLGVIGVIVPWNYPFFNVLSAVVAALFAGNGAVVKVSEWTSHSAEPIEDMFREILAKRGHNPDLVQVITGYGQTGAALVSGGVDKVLFIGSPATGKKVMQAASASLTPVILELGGKDPFIVFEDADWNHMLDIAVRGAFINCGQNCVAAERFYVQDSVYDRFVNDVVALLKKTKQGPSAKGNRCDFGAITMPRQGEIVKELVEDAVKKGAKIAAGGRMYSVKDIDEKSGDVKGSSVASPAPMVPDANQSTFFLPTVLRDVTHSMRIANEETFGPVMTIIRFKDEKDLLDMVNSTVFGLGSSVFTTDYKRADRVASQLETGMVTVNDFAMVPMVQSLPFGGVKESGFGHFNGKEGLRGFSRITAVVSDRFPIRMAAPAFLQYPVAANATSIVKAGLPMVYGNSWLTSVTGLCKMMKLIVLGGD